MIAKVMGVLMLATGGGYLCVQDIRRHRNEIRFLYELASALESMEGMIRWEKVALPTAMERQCSRDLCGGFFLQILELMKSGSGLQYAWESIFVNVKMASAILRSIELSGDETRITGQLHLAAQQLRKRAEQYSAGRAESEKLRVSVCASAVGLLAILLF